MTRSSLFVLAVLAAAVAAARPSPAAEVARGDPDPGLSLPFYPVIAGADRGCIHMGRPTADPELVHACEAAKWTYRLRANHMIAAQRPETAPADRERHCAEMAAKLAPWFTHLQGPKDLLEGGRGGYTFMGKAELLAGCRGGRMFDVTFFEATALWAVAIDKDRAVATTCYVQDQVGGANSPTGDAFPGGRPATYRIAVEPVSRRDAFSPWLTDSHNAHDVPKETVFRSCTVPPPPPAREAK